MRAPAPDLMERLEALAEVHDLAAVEKNWLLAARRLAQMLGEDQPKYRNRDDCRNYVRDFFFTLLNEDRYLEAGALTWHRGAFDPRPLHVQRIFSALTLHDMVLLVGAGGLGKTNNTCAWFALDLIRDPRDTTIKLAATSERNLRGNMFARISSYVQYSLFTHDFDISDKKTTIRMPDGRPDTGIEGVFLGRDTTSKGALKGYHPQPFRAELHPDWGHLTRVRILMDEAQQFTEGVKEDLGSPIASMSKDGKHMMKIVATANPVSDDKWVLKDAAPAEGWREEYMRTHYDWESPHGWHVCRVDAAITENVLFHVEQFKGFPKDDTERTYMNGSIPTARWFIFWRGWPPPGFSAEVVVPTAWFDAAIAEPLFIGRVIHCGGLDPSCALDQAVLSVGRYGLASGYLDWRGEEHKFFDRRGDGRTPTPRHVLVVDQQVALKSKEEVAMCKEVREWCEQYGVPPEHLAVDSTGNGVATVSHFAAYWERVIGVHWASGASDRKLLAEHEGGADVYASTIIDEMYYTIRLWIAQGVRGLLINPLSDHRDVLRSELGTRRFDPKTKSLRFEIEPKKKFKLRNGGVSPGYSDALALMTFVPRSLGLPLPAMTDEDFAAARAAERQKSGGRRRARWGPTVTSTSAAVTAQVTGKTSYVAPRLSMNGQRSTIIPPDFLNRR